MPRKPLTDRRKLRPAMEPALDGGQVGELPRGCKIAGASGDPRVVQGKPSWAPGRRGDSRRRQDGGATDDAQHRGADGLPAWVDVRVTDPVSWLNTVQLPLAHLVHEGQI